MVEQTPTTMVQFTPGKLPSNEYAFKNCIYVNPQDYAAFVAQNGNRQPVYVKVKHFVLKLDQIHGLG